jgi:hypothetical protein
MSFARIPEPCDVPWPNHEWKGDEYGHNCAGCSPDSVWKCDKAAHRIGEFARQQGLETRP